jgi:hypothetical protein
MHENILAAVIGWMKPNPLVPLNHFAMPVATQATISWRL